MLGEPILFQAAYQWFAILRGTLKMDGLLVEAEGIMAKHDPEGRIGLFVDEWGTWYSPFPGSNPAFLVHLDRRREDGADADLPRLRHVPKLASVTGRVLTADSLDAHNTVDAPNRVQPAAFTGATLPDSALKVRLPPRSVVVLTLAAGGGDREWKSDPATRPALGSRVCSIASRRCR